MDPKTTCRLSHCHPEHSSKALSKSPDADHASQLESIFHQLEERTVSYITTPENAQKSSPLLPSPAIREALKAQTLTEREAFQAGLAIERPRSALHSGDFTQETHMPRQGLLQQESIDNSPLYNPVQPSWLATSPPRDFEHPKRSNHFHPVSQAIPNLYTGSRAPSLSSSISSFVFKPPTSPLVQSESNDDIDSSSMNPIDIATAFSSHSRRHTFQSSNPLQYTPSLPTSSSFNKPLQHLRRDNPYPYQAHQPRRSNTSNQNYQFDSSPQTPAYPRSRRRSCASESSPIQHASMVGSYEESILRGRMSSKPSKPLDFVAQIGVLGLGKCKSSLRCPAHVTVPFPAVFYSYGTTTHGRPGNEDGPSPYVGQIDLENCLQNSDEVHDLKRKRHISSSNLQKPEAFDLREASIRATPSEREIRKARKQKRRSTSPQAPPGGSYRIPERGQLQIIIKNPNKTAVKLFLVPYDLTGMEPGTKTFIRQRSYSAGPAIESPVPSSPTQTIDGTKERSILRYLVHLHVCSPSRGKFYLYKSIRVVFANRVPDGKEKLRNEIQIPEPRWSVYKPSRDTNNGISLGSLAGANLAAEKAFRRRSSVFALGPSYHNFDAIDSVSQPMFSPAAVAPAYPYTVTSGVKVESIPLGLTRQNTSHVRCQFGEDKSLLQSPTSSKSSCPPTSHNAEMAGSWDSSIMGLGTYDKLSKGDIGYGGNAFTSALNGQRAVAEGLLAKKLKGLGVGRLEQ
jgi:hypothetical protein